MLSVAVTDNLSFISLTGFILVVIETGPYDKLGVIIACLLSSL